MAAEGVSGRSPARRLPWPLQLGLLALICAAVGLAAFLGKARSAAEGGSAPGSNVAGPPFRPSAAQLATFTIRPVEERRFQVEYVTEGKIGVDEDRTTPIFSQYSGRVLRLVARQGEIVAAGQVLFTIEASDMVQAQNDLLAANGALNKARSQLQLNTTIERRQHDLFDAKAIALKDWQAAQNDLVSAQNDLRAADGALEAVRNRLKILGKTDDEVRAFLANGRMSPDSPVVSPIAGTVTQRKIGPGQLITGGAGDPSYTIGDLSSVWLLANVRESEAPNVAIGQILRFRVLAFPNRIFESRIAYVAAAIDPATRRIQVRAEVPNYDGTLKPEMFASVRIATGVGATSPAVPREAVIYEADRARVWVVAPDGSVGLRQVETGILDADTIQITGGLRLGERVITRGSLFIDRLASGDVT